jgi:uncharacterized protein (TIGR00255 family)
MTGFGTGRVALGGVGGGDSDSTDDGARTADGRGEVVVEIRAVNHRFVDARVRVSPELADLAFELEELSRTRLGRGRFDVSARLEGAAAPGGGLDADAARRGLAALRALVDDLGLAGPISVEQVLRLPGVVRADGRPSPEHAARLAEALRDAFARAERALRATQDAEGARLAAALSAVLEHLGVLRAAAAARAPEVVAGHRARLTERLARLAPQLLADEPSRLEREAALFAERSDVTEELTRLDAHLAHAREVLALDGDVGKRFEFVLQELSREASTLGAKAQDVELGRLVVEMKLELERLREQIQNVA